MLPRYTSDYRTLLWALVLFPSLPLVAYVWPASAPWLFLPALYLSYCSGVLTHNHVHVPVFARRGANALYSAWLSIFYGCPVAFWIPTHLENHHRFLDGPEDVTRTTRRSLDNGLGQLIVYSLACAHWQRPLIESYVRRAHARRGQHWAALRDQSAALLLAHAAMLALAVSLHGFGRGLFTYALSFGLPALLAPTFMMFTNYIQHVHCDPASPDDHSRNFVDRFSNWFVFDAGYHTVHHDRPSVHWSRYAALHGKRAARMHPSSNEHSVLWFCVKNYVAGALLPSLRTTPQAARALDSSPTQLRKPETLGLEHRSAY
jgi:beta-carotene hydroxylase